MASSSSAGRVFAGVDSVGDKLAINRDELDEVLRHRGFVIPSFQIYGGTTKHTTHDVTQTRAMINGHTILNDISRCCRSL